MLDSHVTYLKKCQNHIHNFSEPKSKWRVQIHYISELVDIFSEQTRYISERTTL